MGNVFLFLLVFWVSIPWLIRAKQRAHLETKQAAILQTKVTVGWHTKTGSTARVRIS